MTRTYSALIVVLSVFLLATFAVGWWTFFVRPGDAATAAETMRFKQDLFLVHFYLGLGTALGMLLVHCLIFTYFLGTGRWVKEVGIAYRLPDQPYPKATRELKRRVFPPALFAMLIGIATAAAGAGAQLQAWPWYAHATLAVVTLLINAWAFRVELRCLSENARVLEGVLVEVDRIRTAQGLLPNAVALAQEAETR